MSSRGEASPVSHLQETFLNGARRERLQVVIRLMDGTEVDCRIKSFDRFSVLVEHNGADHMLFKHAIALIRPFATDLPGGAS